MTPTNITGRRYSAVVISPAVTWFANAVTGDHRHRPTIPEVADGDLRPVIAVASNIWASKTGEVTVIWRGDFTPDVHRLLSWAALEGGWTVNEKAGLESGWFTFRKAGTGTVHLGVAPMFTGNVSQLVTYGDAKAISWRIAQFNKRVGKAFAGKSGVVGGELLIDADTRTYRKLSGQPAAERIWEKAPLSVVGRSPQLMGSAYVRRIAPHEQERRYVHHFDVRLMFLAAFATVEVGRQVPVNAKGTLFDRGMSGYWQIDLDEVREAHDEAIGRTGKGLAPDLHALIGARTRVSRTWVTTPVMTYLEDVNVYPKVFDAYVSPGKSRVFRDWAKHLGDIISAVEDETSGEDGEILRTAVKGIANEFRGMLAKKSGRWYRPDWSDTIIDQARVSLVRRIAAANVHPVRYHQDSIWFATDMTASEASRALHPHQDRRLGAMRYEDSMTPAEYRGKFEMKREKVAK